MQALTKNLPFIFLILVYVSCKSGNSENHAQAETTQPVAESTTETNTDKAGQNLYLKYCMACHQTDGSGVPGMYPPLKNSPIINGGKKEEIIKILLNGLKGPIEINGKTYNQQMPSQNFLSNEDLSQIINYVSNSFQNKGPEVTPDDIQQMRNKSTQ